MLFFRQHALSAARRSERTARCARRAGGRLASSRKPYCERLGTPFAYDLGVPGLQSPEAMAHPPVYQRARAVARFEDGPVRVLIHRLKYGDRMELAKPLGLWMARAGAELLTDADLLVPVPLHRRRLIWRQFNQANALAEIVGRASGKKVDPFALMRVKRTVPQVGLTRSQRADNVQGAFKVSEAASLAVAGRNVFADRRCADVRRDAECRGACLATRRGGARRCPGFRQGCERRLKSHM